MLERFHRAAKEKKSPRTRLRQMLQVSSRNSMSSAWRWLECHHTLERRTFGGVEPVGSIEVQCLFTTATTLLRANVRLIMLKMLMGGGCDVVVHF